MKPSTQVVDSASQLAPVRPPETVSGGSRMQCMQVWGGSGVADTAVSTTGLDIVLYSQPYGNHEAGGDVYYLSSCSSGRITRWALTDVCGHGETVVALAKTLRGLMQRHINHVNQRTLVESINREFVSVGDSGTFATGLIATFFVPTSTLTLTNAGHPPPFLYAAQQQTWQPLEQTSSSEAGPANLPLGVFESTSYAQVRVKMTTEDLLLCSTDGLEESVDEQGEMLGRDGLLKLVTEIGRPEPDRLIPELVRRVKALCETNLTHDDVTIMLIRPNGASVPLRDNLLAPFRYLSGILRSAS